MEKLEKEPPIHEVVNNLFLKYDFEYFNMINPFPSNKRLNGEIIFKGKRDEYVRYNQLSSGEQMIVKFVILAMGRDVRGDRINTLVFDEPDAHLHPKMCKMMIDILREISISTRVIITTHSPSTIAFAPDDSLYIMEKDNSGNRSIRQSTKQDALEVLSEGIFTFEKAVKSFKIIERTVKSTILCVEGKTDVIHINEAMTKLRRNLDIEIVNLFNSANLSEFVRSVPNSLLRGKKIIALLDNDEEGRRVYGNIKGEYFQGFKIITATQCDGKAFALTIPSAELELQQYCPIEFLYPLELLKEKNAVILRHFKEYKALYKVDSPEQDKVLNKEFEEQSSKRVFKANDNVKNYFANEAKGFGKEAFKGFIPLLNKLDEIIKR